MGIIVTGTFIVDKQLEVKYFREQSLSKRELTLKEEHEEMLKMLNKVSQFLKLKINMKSHFLSIKLDYISQPDLVINSAFSGHVVNSLENWNNKYVIGLTGNETRIVEDTLEYQPINQVSVLPPDSKIDKSLVVSNLKPLCTALLCDYFYMRTNENETVVIVSDNWENTLPYVQWILLKNAQVVVYVPKADEEREAALKSKWTRHPFFKHPTFKTKFHKVTLRSVYYSELSSDILKVTSNYGASVTLVLAGAVETFNTEQVSLHREVLMGAGVNSRVVWSTKLEQMDPCECECIFNKGISLNFFNLKAILETESHVGIVQHALVETLKHICNNSLFLSEHALSKFKSGK
ncbi:hypothetical protein MACJ_001442 [Theileria orientalis]|uniref:Uncharacterized protein n=1 Tax=Theileria orientalis TaxID=68886 RepID=A0A976QTF4_THEOR|nr:hypothetical protein MACJ_001442 [Theileria orientalis]